MYDCEFCHKEYHSRRSQVRHLKECVDNPSKCDYNCQHCNRRYNSRDSLTRHLRVSHPQFIKADRIDQVIDQSVNNSHNEGSIIGDHNTVNHTVNNQIYLVRDPNFLQTLVEIMGSEEGALLAIKRAAYNKIQGEVELFEKVYLRGNDPSLWPIVCTDQKNCIFKIKNRDGTWTSDPGAKKIWELFCGNYTDSILMTINRFLIEPLVDKNVGSEDYSTRATSLMDHIDFMTLQTRPTELYSPKYRQDQFAKELIKAYYRRLRTIQEDLKTDQQVAVDQIITGSQNRSSDA